MKPDQSQVRDETISINGKRYVWKRFYRDETRFGIFDMITGTLYIEDVREEPFCWTFNELRNYYGTDLLPAPLGLLPGIYAWNYAKSLSDDHLRYMLEIKQYIHPIFL